MAAYTCLVVPVLISANYKYPASWYPAVVKLAQGKTSQDITTFFVSEMPSARDIFLSLMQKKNLRNGPITPKFSITYNIGRESGVYKSLLVYEQQRDFGECFPNRLLTILLCGLKMHRT